MAHSEIVKVVKLTEPVQAHGEPITELKIRKPRGKDFKKLPGKSFEAPFQLILDFAAHLADVPPSTLDELCAEDTAAVSEVVGPFLDKFQGIGKT